MLSAGVILVDHHQFGLLLQGHWMPQIVKSGFVQQLGCVGNQTLEKGCRRNLYKAIDQGLLDDLFRFGAAIIAQPRRYRPVYFAGLRVCTSY